VNFHCIFSNTLFRTTKSYGDTISQRPQSPLWTSRFCPKSCRSKILANEVEQNTLTLSTKIRRFQQVGLAAQLQSRQAENPQTVEVAFSVAALISRKVFSMSAFMLRFYTDSPPDCPQTPAPFPLSNRGSMGSGANAAPTSARQWGAGRESRSWRDRNDSGSFQSSERYKRDPPNDTSFNRNRDVRSGSRDDRETVSKHDYDDNRRRSRRSRTRSRSRSPRQTGRRVDERNQRVRSRERSGDHDYRDSDKRRRLD
jgi:hypothetical protein